MNEQNYLQNNQLQQQQQQQQDQLQYQENQDNQNNNSNHVYTQQQFIAMNSMNRNIELSAISEENQSKISQSYMVIDILEVVNFNNNIDHDLLVLQKALNALKKCVYQSNKMAQQHYQKLKDKVDQFFQIHSKYTPEESKKISVFCNDLNNFYYILQQKNEISQEIQFRKKSFQSLENSKYLFKKQPSNATLSNNKNENNISHSQNYSPRKSLENSNGQQGIYSPHIKRVFSSQNDINETISKASLYIIEFSEHYSQVFNKIDMIQKPYPQQIYKQFPFTQKTKELQILLQNQKQQNKEIPNIIHTQQHYLKNVQNQDEQFLVVNKKQNKCFTNNEFEEQFEEDDEEQKTESTKKEIQEKQTHLSNLIIKENYQQNDEKYQQKNNKNDNKEIQLNNENILNQNLKQDLNNNQEEDSFKICLVNIQELIKQAEEEYLEKMLFLAQQTCQQITNLVDKYSKYANLTKDEKQQINNIYTSKAALFLDVKDLAVIVNGTTKYLQIKEGWIEEKEKKNIKVSYQKFDSSPMITLKIQAKVDLNIKTVLSLIYEVELYTKWLPFCSQGTQVKQLDRASKVVHLKFNLPFVSDREVYLYGTGVDRAHENGKILVVVKSVDLDEQFQQKHDIQIPKESKCVRADVPFFVFEIEPNLDKKDSLNILAVGNFDAKLAFAPDSVVNFIIRKFAFMMFEKMLSLGQPKKFKNSQWEKNIQANPYFYDWIDEKYNKYFNEQSGVFPTKQ